MLAQRSSPIAPCRVHHRGRRLRPPQKRTRNCYSCMGSPHTKINKKWGALSGRHAVEWEWWEWDPPRHTAVPQGAEPPATTPGTRPGLIDSAQCKKKRFEMVDPRAPATGRSPVSNAWPLSGTATPTPGSDSGRGGAGVPLFFGRSRNCGVFGGK